MWRPRTGQREVITTPVPLVTNTESLTGFVGCYLRHGPDHCRQEPGRRIVLGLLGQPFQHRQCTSGQPDEWVSKTPLSPDPL